MKMRGWRSSACMRRSKFRVSSLGRIYLVYLVPYVLGMRRIPSDPREKPWLRPCGREKKKTPRWREGGGREKSGKSRKIEKVGPFLPSGLRGSEDGSEVDLADFYESDLV